MTTATEIIKDALEDIGYLAAETPLEASDEKKAFNVLNDMLSEWGISGILPGAAPVENTTDELRVPRETEGAIKKNLAGLCAAPFRRPISPELGASIKASNEALLRMTVKLGRVKLPNTLPKGSGNRCNGDVYDNTFFGDNGEANF